MVPYANPRRSRICPESQATENIQKKGARLEAEAASASALRHLVVEIGQEFGVEVLRVDGVVMGGVVMQTEVLVGNAGDLASMEGL